LFCPIDEWGSDLCFHNPVRKLKILVRKAKNRYSWIGFGGVPMALRELKVCICVSMP
jgi:hypothetical protein